MSKINKTFIKAIVDLNTIKKTLKKMKVSNCALTEGNAKQKKSQTRQTLNLQTEKF